MNRLLSLKTDKEAVGKKEWVFVLHKVSWETGNK